MHPSELNPEPEDLVAKADTLAAKLREIVPVAIEYAEAYAGYCDDVLKRESWSDAFFECIDGLTHHSTITGIVQGIGEPLDTVQTARHRASAREHLQQSMALLSFYANEMEVTR